MVESSNESTGCIDHETLSLDTLFTLLSNRRRRQMLYYLSKDGNSVAEIDDVITAIDQFDAERSVADGERTDVRTSLIHVHLPKTAAAGIIDFDRRSETIRYIGHPLLEKWLDRARAIDTGT